MVQTNHKDQVIIRKGPRKRCSKSTVSLKNTFLLQTFTNLYKISILLYLYLSFICTTVQCDNISTQGTKVYSSCLEVFQELENSKQSSISLINSVIRLPDNSVLEVDCLKLNRKFDFLELFYDAENSETEVHTIVHHDSEETKPVQGFESPGSFKRSVKYKNVSSMFQLEQLIESSYSCQQFIKWECRGSTFSYWYPKTHHSWWVDRHGIAQNYWGNAETNSSSCGCFPYCFPTFKNSTCNCDANLKTQWLEDSGLLLDKRHLPVTELRFGDTGESYEAGKYTLGPLICRNSGHKTRFLGNFSAPTIIKSPGFPENYPPPFRIYEWTISVQKDQYIELVFPTYDIIHYGSYNSVEGCKFTILVDVYVRNSDTGEWNLLETIKRQKHTPPYYVTDGHETMFVLRFITCNQYPQQVMAEGFLAEFRISKCRACNVDYLADRSKLSVSNCKVEPAQCVYIYSPYYPMPHHSFGEPGKMLQYSLNLTTTPGNRLQIEFNDFDINHSPGQQFCDADLLTLEGHAEYCNINRYNIGKYTSTKNTMNLELKVTLRKVGNSRGIHATAYSVPETPVTKLKWIVNAAKGKPADQSSTRGSMEASLAVDGMIEPRDPSQCSSTNYEREPWWRVNLQKRHRIHGLKIWSLTRKDTATLGPRAPGTPTNVSKVIWPDGEYALPMPVSGCPENTWKTGMRFHGVQHDKPYDDKTHYWSEDIRLMGGATKHGIEQHFCVHKSAPKKSSSNLKNPSSDSSTESNTWMPGKYCIFQFGDNCPDGFHSGSITWFDKSKNSRNPHLNALKGETPSGMFTSHNTTLNFCCREDGQPQVPIRLPTKRPFYLLQYGQVCQEVEGMGEVEHFFHYEEEVVLSGSSMDFIFTTDQKLKFQDPHPRIDATLFDRGLTLHYCYYDIADKLKGFRVLVDTTPDTFGYGRFYDEDTGMTRPVNKQFLSAVECVNYSVTDDEFEMIELNCSQPIDGQYVIIFMSDRNDALQLCQVQVFGEESCGRPLGLATEEILDSAIMASSFDDTHGSLFHPYNVRLNSPKAWCAAPNDPDKFVQIDLRPWGPSFVSTETSREEDSTHGYVTIVGVAMQGMQMTFKSYFVTQFKLFFSNDSTNWFYEEEPIGTQKLYRCIQCDAQHIDANEIVMYNLLKPIVARFLKIQIISFQFGPCMRLELIGCRGDKDFCSRSVVASSPGIISSPNYPYYYGQHKHCHWNISPSDPEKHIELDFIIMDLAPAEKSSGNCHDQLIVEHQNGSRKIVIEPSAVQRGSELSRVPQFPKKIVSNGPVSIELHSCFRLRMSRFQGFLLRYRETDCPGCGVGDSVCSAMHNCSSLCGQIMSINYPLNYVGNHRCQWRIRAPIGYYFNVTIQDFDIPDSGHFSRSKKVNTHHNSANSKTACILNHLSFTDPSNGMVLGRYCNTNKPPKYILSNWNELIVVFSPDSSSQVGRGFRLTYQAQRFELLKEAKQYLLPPQPNACPKSWLYFRGYCYSAFFENESLQWHQAEEKCVHKLKGRDGHLVSITDQLEMNVVHYWIVEHWKASPHQSIYIGLIDTNREGFYNWSDGNPMSYTDWYRSQSTFSRKLNDPSLIQNSGNGNSSQDFVSQRPSSDTMVRNSQPDGGAFEDCTVINFYSIHSTANWHDIPCSLGKKAIQSRFAPTSNSLTDGLVRSYICKMDSNSSLHQHSPRIPLFNNRLSDMDRRILETSVNTNQYFICNNYEIISNMFRCDGTANCRDGADETEGCIHNSQQCLESQFQCKNGDCIAIGKYCDFQDDCGDGSDEVHCVRRQCKKNSEYRCMNGQCIPIAKRCDLLPDCQDQSDEGVICHGGGKCNLNSTFQCYYGTCIPIYALCDKHRDCPGKFYEDEHESVCAAMFDDLNHQDANSAFALSPFDLMKSPLRSSPSSSSSVSNPSSSSNPLNPSNALSISMAANALNRYANRFRRNQRAQECEESRQNQHRQTCQDLLDWDGINQDGYYELRPLSTSKLTIRVYCYFENATHAKTVLNHDTEYRLYVKSFVEGPGTWTRAITYEWSSDLIVALIDESLECRQSLSFECSGSAFNFNSSHPNSWWTSRGNSIEYSWGSDKNATCGCYPNCNDSNLRCNCDTGSRFVWSRDFGYVNDKSKLPITKVAFGDVSQIGQLGYVEVGQIECWGRKESHEMNFCLAPPISGDSTLLTKPFLPQFKCNSGQMIEERYKCIYEFDQLGYQIGCRDVSHLRGCQEHSCQDYYVKCPDSYCIPFRYICNGKWDCVGGYDEIGCARFTCPGKYKCANESSCIHVHQLCDGFRHCPLGDDEWFCDIECPKRCSCAGLYIDCRYSSVDQESIVAIPHQTRKLDLTGNHLGPDLSAIDFSPFSDLGELILVDNNIEVIKKRKFIHLTNLYKLDLSRNRIKTIEEAAFAGLEQVTSLILEGNPMLSEIHSAAFVGLVSLRELNISNTGLADIKRNLFLQMHSLQKLILTNNYINTVEKGAFTDLTSLTSLDLRGNPLNNYGKDMFVPLKSLRYLSTDSFKFCCFVSGNVPFSRCLPPQDEISDCEDLMSNTVQRLMLWVLGICAFFGNFLVVIWRYRTRTHTNRVSSTLILSLGCSDFIMGVYLLIIASVDEYYRGRYIENADFWKNSALCNLCGFLSTISSEMSVATLVFISIDRLISISLPFSSYRFTLKFTYRLLMITWVVVFILSALPLLPFDYFNGQFYARSGVCLALHITTRRSPGWEYSVAIFIILNLIAFMIILFCYTYMYKTISGSTRATRTMHVAKHVREAKIGKLMMVIVGTNFLCWFPVIVMGFMALAGVNISGSAYSWIAVVVLPLNSATDPLMYTLLQFIPDLIANRQQERQQKAFNNRLQHVDSRLRMAPGGSISQLQQNITRFRQDDMNASILFSPPTGYESLAQFLKNHDPLTPPDMLQISYSLSKLIKELHEQNYALGTINMDNVFVSKAFKRTPSDNDSDNGLEEVDEGSYELQTYIPAIGFAYKVPISYDEDDTPEDFAVNMEEFGNLVKRMLQYYHAKQLKLQQSHDKQNDAIIREDPSSE